MSAHIRVRIDGQSYYEHRIVHKMLAFEEPPDYLDHVSVNDRNDNRYCNLRALSASESAFHRSIPSNNTSGVVGVYWDKARERWAAVIMVNYRRINLGRFHEFEDAVAARRAAELKYFGEVAAEMAEREHSIADSYQRQWMRERRALVRFASK
jgi:hypothetical protein